jgi:Fic family protein
VTDQLPELLDCRRLIAETGLTRAAAERLMRNMPTVQIEGLRKTYCRRSDVAAMIRCVRVPDTDRESERATVSARLRENRQRRALLAEKTVEIRAELRDLLVRGSKAALDVAEMARLAGISRDTAHRYLREAGHDSSRQRRALRKEDKDG